MKHIILTFPAVKNGRHCLKKAMLSFLCAGAFLIGGGTGQALAQQDINDRLNRMENDIQTLSRALYRGEGTSGLPAGTGSGTSNSSAVQAKLEVRLSQLEVEIRTLTGKIEQQSYEIRKVTENTERMIADLAQRVSELEEARISGKVKERSSSSADHAGTQQTTPGNTTAMSSAANSASSPSANGMVRPVEDGTMATPPGPVGSLGQLTIKENTDDGTQSLEKPAAETPSGLYEQAFSLLKDKEYKQASEYFTMFLDRYPGHQLAANAKYWLGETYYVQNDYERAARIFAEAYQQYADGVKGPDSLLKLGMSLAGMGNEKDACFTYGEIERRYPSGSESILSRARQEKEALGCSSR